MGPLRDILTQNKQAISKQVGIKGVVKAIIVLCMTSAAYPVKSEEIFEIKALPPGANVTISRPATTNIPLDTRVRLSATDAPQSVSFTVVSTTGRPAHPIKVAIFDSQQEKVRYLEVKSQAVALYSFQGLSSIVIMPQADKSLPAAAKAQVMLQIASDKPLTMQH